MGQDEPDQHQPLKALGGGDKGGDVCTPGDAGNGGQALISARGKGWVGAQALGDPVPSTPDSHSPLLPRRASL